MIDDQFTRLFKRVEDGFAAMEKRFDEMATKDQVNTVYDLLDKNISEPGFAATNHCQGCSRFGRW